MKRALPRWIFAYAILSALLVLTPTSLSAVEEPGAPPIAEGTRYREDGGQAARPGDVAQAGNLSGDASAGVSRDEAAADSPESIWAGGPRLFLDGTEIRLPDPIQNREGRIYLPLRSFCEILGAKVDWLQDQNSVGVLRNRVEAVFSAGSGLYSVNGKERHMSDAVLYLDQTINRVYIPIRYGAETFGFIVDWRNEGGEESVYVWSTDISDGALTDNEVTVADRIIWLGQTESQIVEAFGYPNRVDESAYGMQWYVYNRDYSGFVMVGIANQRVRAFFTNAKHLGLKDGLGYGAEQKDVEAAGYRSDTMEFWYDPHDGDRLYAVFCLVEYPAIGETQLRYDQNGEILLRAYEMECLDITNAFRLANGMPLVLYSNYAAKVALAYAKDMADRNQVTHFSQDGKDALDRFEAQGIYVRQVSENLAGGFSDAMHAMRGWVESAGHRANLLEDNQYLGVGAFYKPSSRYRYYSVQEFITFD